MGAISGKAEMRAKNLIYKLSNAVLNMVSNEKKKKCFSHLSRKVEDISVWYQNQVRFVSCNLQSLLYSILHLHSNSKLCEVEEVIQYQR